MKGRLSVYSSAIHLDAYTLSAYGGTVQGAAALDYSSASLPVTVTATVHGVNLERVVRTLSPQARKITGTLDAALRLATALGPDPRGALRGVGTFAVRAGSLPGLDLQGTLAHMARALQLAAPGGDTRFRYFGGDLRIERERVHSTSLRLDAEALEGTARGSFGFDKTLDYTGTTVLRTLTSGTTPGGGPSPSPGQMLSTLLHGPAGATGARVPFSLRGTVDDPKFSLAGIPELIRDQSPPHQPPPQPQQPTLPSPQDLFKLFQ
jgi:hypothetical protein